MPPPRPPKPSLSSGSGLLPPPPPAERSPTDTYCVPRSASEADGNYCVPTSAGVKALRSNTIGPMDSSRLRKGESLREVDGEEAHLERSVIQVGGQDELVVFFFWLILKMIVLLACWIMYLIVC